MEYDLQEFFIDPRLSKNHLGTFLMNELILVMKDLIILKNMGCVLKGHL